MKRFRFNKAFLLVFTALLLASCNGNITEPNEQDEVEMNKMKTEISKAMKAQEAAWNAGDIPGFMAYYKNDPEISFVSSRGVDKGYETILARYLKSYPDKATMGKLEFEILEFIPAGANNAMLIGKWTLYRENDQPGGYFSLLWENSPKGWKIIIDHTS
ncbi:nuclear transport factor 2 family protein [Cryomorpha ignava]|uniref:Nuclear transport factor 2 family protein n=1 Tax=Cryomorpha ignava TaxID=101383 RepID=A0A7K3WXH5_9FLAO|nr:nuclear transport factor 2 family protein [Cryomorpha ignava]NEN25335.1 nuclear transport factor 2 family protein [Cryomorpha ignava]